MWHLPPITPKQISPDSGGPSTVSESSQPVSRSQQARAGWYVRPTFLKSGGTSHRYTQCAGHPNHLERFSRLPIREARVGARHRPSRFT